MKLGLEGELSGGALTSMCNDRKSMLKEKIKMKLTQPGKKGQIHVRLCEGKSKQRRPASLGERTGERQDSLRKHLCGNQ